VFTRRRGLESKNSTEVLKMLGMETKDEEHNEAYPGVMEPGAPYMKPSLKEPPAQKSWNPRRTANLIGMGAMRGRGTGDSAPLMKPVLWAKPLNEVDSEDIAANVKGKDELNILDFEEQNEILATEECLTVQVAMDSGAIKHVTPPDCLPQGVKVHSGDTRNFQAANGGTIKNYGTAEVTIKGSNDRQANVLYHVAEVTRTLHATGQVCDQGFEVLHTKHGAVTVPEGHLSQFLVADAVVAKYPRRNGGLYVAEFKVTAPKPRPPPNDAGSGFTRPGAPQ